MGCCCRRAAARCLTPPMKRCPQLLPHHSLPHTPWGSATPTASAAARAAPCRIVGAARDADVCKRPNLRLRRRRSSSRRPRRRRRCCRRCRAPTTGRRGRRCAPTRRAERAAAGQGHLVVRLRDRVCVLGGVAEASIERIARVIKDAGNAVRMPVAADECSGPTRAAATTRSHNPELAGLPVIEQLAAVVRALGDVGLLVMLDVHNLVGMARHGLLGAADHPAAAWGKLSRALCDEDKYWTSSPPTSRTSRTGCSGAAAAHGPPVQHLPRRRAVGRDRGRDRQPRARGVSRWVIVVEGALPGLGRHGGPTASGRARASGRRRRTTWWARTCRAPRGTRCNTGSADALAGRKVVYSPHHRPGTWPQAYFEPTAGFPANMPTVWDTQYGSLAPPAHAARAAGGRVGRPGKMTQDAVWQNAMPHCRSR